MNDLQFKLYTPYDQLTSIQMDEVTDFLYEHMQYLYQHVGFENKYLEMRLKNGVVSYDRVLPSKEGRHPSSGFN